MWSEVNKKCEFCILGTRFFELIFPPCPVEICFLYRCEIVSFHEISAYDCPKVNPGHMLEKSSTVILKYVLDSSWTKFLVSGQRTWKKRFFSLFIYPLPPL